MRVYLALLISLMGGVSGGGSVQVVEPIELVGPEVVVSLPYSVPAKWVNLMVLECESMQVPLWVAARLFERESGWNAYKRCRNVNGSEDLGMCQFNDKYLYDFQCRFNGGKPFDPFVPTEAVPVALRYLRSLYGELGSWASAVGAYNCGLSRWKSGAPDSTIEHVRAVMGH